MIAKHRKTIGERIREARQGANLTQFELGEKVGVRPGEVSDWERGDHIPSVVSLHKIAVSLGVSMDSLV